MYQCFWEALQTLYSCMEAFCNEHIESGSHAVGSPAVHLQVGISFDKLWQGIRFDEVFVSRK